MIGQGLGDQTVGIGSRGLLFGDVLDGTGGTRRFPWKGGVGAPLLQIELVSSIAKVLRMLFTGDTGEAALLVGVDVVDVVGHGWGRRVDAMRTRSILGWGAGGSGGNLKTIGPLRRKMPARAPLRFVPSVPFGSEVRYTFPLRQGSHSRQEFALPVAEGVYWYNAHVECVTAAGIVGGEARMRLMLETAEGPRVLWSGCGRGWVGLGWPVPAVGLVTLVVEGSAWVRVELQGFQGGRGGGVEDHCVLFASGLPQWLFHRGVGVVDRRAVWSAHEVYGGGEATGLVAQGVGQALAAF